MLSKELIQYNLEEAEEEIAIMLEKVRSEGEYSETAFLHSMQHLITTSTSRETLERRPPMNWKRPIGASGAIFRRI